MPYVIMEPNYVTSTKIFNNCNTCDADNHNDVNPSTLHDESTNSNTIISNGSIVVEYFAYNTCRIRMLNILTFLKNN